MSLYDLIIRNGQVVTANSVTQADIAVADGRITDIASALEGTAKEEIDAGGLHVFPGVIDAHLHFNEPGRADWEGFATGTRALAAGGTTTYFDMPLNSHPPTTDAEAFDLKLAAAQAQSLVDFGLWGGLVPGNLDRMEELVERGVVGFKAFMSNSGIDDFQAVDDLTLYEGMANAAKLGCIIAVHAENDAITGLMGRRAISEGKLTVRDYLDSRPVIAELEAIIRAILFARETGCALHIVHVSTWRGVSLVAASRLSGIDVSCETCPHYLSLTDEDVEQLGAVAKCAPPIRSQGEQEALWRHLADGSLEMVASDHSPSPPDMKTGDDFFKIWGVYAATPLDGWLRPA
jgi:allantoinase